MAHLKSFKRDPVFCLKELTDKARYELLNNINMIENNVNSRFLRAQDPTFKKYLELSEQMQEMFKQMSEKMYEISEHCQKIIGWIDNYLEF